MNRTRYFTNPEHIQVVVRKATIWREKAGKREFWNKWNELGRGWKPSAFNNFNGFKQITRDEARKFHPAAFRNKVKA